MGAVRLRFKIDENLPAEAAAVLRDADHDAATVLKQAMGGRPDGDIAQVCRAEGRAIVTLDLDFADIRRCPPEEHAGLVVLRLASQAAPSVLAVITRTLPLLQREPLDGHLWIVDDGGVRIRAGKETD
jgi:predicted nuclease of predicted toxin-antitoxin system